jgi:hypothetical protein
LRYRRESRYLRGDADGLGTGPSVVFFTVTRCASTFMRHLLRVINRRHLHLLPLNLAAYLWDTGQGGVYQRLSREARQLFRERGVLYAPLRNYVDLAHLRQGRVIAMLRDPRDVAVSGYFAARYSHRPPASAKRKVEFQSHRQAVMAMSIDEYVMDFATRLGPIYEGYRTHLPRAQVLTYEEMWNDFPAWARRLAGLLGVEFSEGEIAEYARMAGAGVARTEDTHSHRRQGAPGDHRQKLSPATAERLTAMFAPSLEWLYGRDAA